MQVYRCYSFPIYYTPILYSPLSFNTKVCPITTNTCLPEGADAVRVVLPCDSAPLVARLQQWHGGVKVRTPWPAARRSCHSTTSCFSAGSSPAVLTGQEGSNRSRGAPGELDSSNENCLRFRALPPKTMNLTVSSFFYAPKITPVAMWNCLGESWTAPSARL